MSYHNERKLETHHYCDCGGKIFNLIVQKRMGHAGGFPKSVKSTGVCECGIIHWKNDLTQLAKDDWDDYLHETSESARRHMKLKRMFTDGHIDKAQWDEIQRNAEKAGW